MDIFSRKIVGYNVFESESATYAEEVITEASEMEGVNKHQVALHSDNGSPMKAATFLATLQKLGITPSYSRPSVSNDNPYSEALFKTTQYCPKYPKRPFSSLEFARLWADEFVHWYNNKYLHNGIKFITPDSRHNGKADLIINQREKVYEAAKEKNPMRWTKSIRNFKLPTEVLLNPSQAIEKQALRY